MNQGDFEHLMEDGERIEDQIKSFDFTENDSLVDEVTNEYGEIEDETPSSQLDDSSNDPNTHTTQSSPIAVHHIQSSNNSTAKHSWLKRSFLAPNETDKEFELFKIFCRNSGGRSIDYISRVSNVQASTINKIAKKNNWKRRSADYDIAELAAKARQAENSRHQLHILKLERYREEHELLGQQITSNAARIALIANSTLSKLIDEEARLGVKDLPAMLNAAAKLAEVGKSLQSSALGVDSLLSALEEGED